MCNRPYTEAPQKEREGAFVISVIRFGVGAEDTLRSAGYKVQCRRRRAQTNIVVI